MIRRRNSSGPSSRLTISTRQRRKTCSPVSMPPGRNRKHLRVAQRGLADAAVTEQRACEAPAETGAEQPAARRRRHHPRPRPIRQGPLARAVRRLRPRSLREVAFLNPVIAGNGADTRSRSCRASRTTSLMSSPCVVGNASSTSRPAARQRAATPSLPLAAQLGVMIDRDHQRLDPGQHREIADAVRCSTATRPGSRAIPAGAAG